MEIRKVLMENLWIFNNNFSHFWFWKFWKLEKNFVKMRILILNLRKIRKYNHRMLWKVTNYWKSAVYSRNRPTSPRHIIQKSLENYQNILHTMSLLEKTQNRSKNSRRNKCISQKLNLKRKQINKIESVVSPQHFNLFLYSYFRKHTIKDTKKSISNFPSFYFMQSRDKHTKRDTKRWRKGIFL